MTLNEYQRKALRTANKELPGKGALVALSYAALKLSGEAGELADMVGKWIGQGHGLEAGKVKEELGDVLWHLNLFASYMGFNLESVARENIDKLLKRYPEGFDENRSKIRDEVEEMLG